MCTSSVLTSDEIGMYITPHDQRRLQSYANHIIEYHVIMDLVPRLAALYFAGKLPVSDHGVPRCIAD